MKLSVIIPVYNISAYLEECVQSVLRQTYVDYEIILVDDGSTDGSSLLCDEFSAHDARIRVIHKENGGLSDARNAGLLAAQGEYIHFLDGDDYYTTKNDLQTLLDELVRQQNPDVLLFCRRDFYEDTGRVENMQLYNVEFINNAPNSTEIFRHLLTTQRFNMSACFQLLRRKMLIEHEIFFTKGLLSEDVDWSLALWQKVESVKAINCPAYSYRHRSASISTSLTIRNYKSYEYMFSKWMGILEKQDTELAKLQCEYLAFLYPTLLYSYYTLPKQDKKEAFQMLREMRYVLKYSNTQKSDRVVKSMRYFGFPITVHLFATYAWLKFKLLK